MTVAVEVAFALAIALLSHIHHGDLIVLHNGGVQQVRPVGHAGTELGTRSMRVRAPLCVFAKRIRDWISGWFWRRLW